MKISDIFVLCNTCEGRGTFLGEYDDGSPAVLDCKYCKGWGFKLRPMTQKRVHEIKKVLLLGKLK